MYELNKTDYERVRPLFRKMDIHLPLQAILAGKVDATIYVDNVIHPQTAITWTGHRFYLTGAPGDIELITAARKIFLENFAMKAWKSGIDSYILHYPTDKWENFIQAMLDQKYPIKSSRSYLAIKTYRQDWKNLIPAGYSVRVVDKILLAENWHNLDFLTQEMCSERETVDDFLEKSFGVCLTNKNEIVGMCLSEYNTGHRCEVGIATDEDYQRRGFATLLTYAFFELAQKKDIARIGWHCGSNNMGSIATAQKTGFEKIEDYPIYIGWFDDTQNMARNAYFAHGRGEYAKALSFYERSFKLGSVSDWVYWGAACDAALMGEIEKALRYLTEAIDHGFDDLDQIQNSKYLVNLHGTSGWSNILDRLSQSADSSIN